MKQFVDCSQVTYFCPYLQNEFMDITINTNIHLNSNKMKANGFELSFDANLCCLFVGQK